jgi:hypothetical protein
MNLFEVEEEASKAQKFQGYEHLYERSTLPYAQAEGSPSVRPTSTRIRQGFH